MVIIAILLLLLSAPPVSAGDYSALPPISEEIEVDVEGVEESGFRFTDLGWSSEEDDFYDYEPDQGIFKRGTRAYGYLEIAGFSNYFQEGEYHIDLAVDVYLKSSFGLRLFGQRNVLEFKDSDDEFIDEVWFYLYVDIPWWAPRAKYIAEVVVRDLVNGTELIHQEKITVQ